MGQNVEFSNGDETASGYLSVPESGSGPGLIVIQEWWGLVDHIRDVCDRFAVEGFVALAPDLYHGESTTEPDEAGKLMMALNLDQAVADMSGAIAYLQQHEATTSESLGVTGFCMGGGLALVLAAERPAAFSICVPWYGLIPWEHAQPDWSNVQAKVRGNFAEKDGFFGPDKAKALEVDLKAAGVDADIEIFPGVDHAFFNDTRPEVHDPEQSARAWARTISALHTELG
ncbi:dienelactone hydrolase family protein [Iamia sp. SCSIO 61187]|uniref:dienelactone hydrolase family protein n=1 Tax=Iamia sp. SCSIO 61187 TaxID=2722752 RepID=UPI001C63002E|nr:dienelactone hydrolase family protein [Iamia sp. SCSIO 61187]QYG93983.1 dienelactone hydrolase family protein [Iamia sp. SCSIO 61187]